MSEPRSMLALPALWGGQVHGWIAALGLLRAISTDWPNAQIMWEATHGTPAILDGPDTPAEAAASALNATVMRVPPGGVLPDAPADWPAPGRQHEQHDGTWAGLITPAGHLHPILRLHAAQTLRGIIDAPRRVLATDPGLLLDAITGLGLDERYGAGLWLLRDDQEPAPRASAGRDWLALMALPWMPALLDIDGRPTAAGWVTPPPDPSPAAGWVTPDQIRWRLWDRPVPAGSVAACLAHPEHGPPGPWFGAIRRPRSRTDRYRPPYLTPYRMPTQQEPAGVTR